MAAPDAQRELVFVDVEDRLNALRDVVGVTEVERMPSGDPVSFNALHIIDGGQRPGDSDATATRYDLAFTVHGYIEKGGGAAAHTMLNQLYAATVAALMTEPPLGGLVETIDEGPMQVEVAHIASSRRLVFIVDFYANFPTRRGDPAQPA